MKFHMNHAGSGNESLDHRACSAPILQGRGNNASLSLGGEGRGEGARTLDRCSNFPVHGEGRGEVPHSTIVHTNSLRLANLFLLLTAFLTLFSALPTMADNPILKSEFIFETAPFPSCHASTIPETKSGLVAAWFGGTAEKKKDVGIWISHRGKEGWSEVKEVAEVNSAGVVARDLVAARIGSRRIWPASRRWWRGTGSTPRPRPGRGTTGCATRRRPGQVPAALPRRPRRRASR